MTKSNKADIRALARRYKDKPQMAEALLRHMGRHEQDRAVLSIQKRKNLDLSWELGCMRVVAGLALGANLIQWLLP